MNDLFALLERQVQFIRRQEGYRLFMALPALVDFVQREPRLRCLTDSVVREFEEAVEAYRDADKRCTSEVLNLFETNAAWIEPIYAKIAGKEGDGDVLASPRSRLSECVKRSGFHDGDPLEFRKVDRSQSDAAVSLLKTLADQLATDENTMEIPREYSGMTKRLAEIGWDHQRSHFKLVHMMCSSAGASWWIITDLADAVCPAIPVKREDESFYATYVKGERFKKRMAKADLLLGIDHSKDPVHDAWRAKADSALEIFLEDMAL